MAEPEGLVEQVPFESLRATPSILVPNDIGDFIVLMIGLFWQLGEPTEHGTFETASKWWATRRVTTLFPCQYKTIQSNT
ncbi:MAG: hypothetical protein KAW46_00090 [candidate division Zixibacteria bacterium]|nr:hypothetical protein [candidate division Zixibacteria bacterium]